MLHLHVYKVKHQLEIKTNILFKTNMLLKMWKMKLYTKAIFLRNKKIAPTFNTTSILVFKPFTKENPTKVICEVSYSLYRKLISKEAGKSILLDNKNCYTFLKSKIESVDKNVDILRQASGAKWLSDGETLILTNLEETIFEPVQKD